MSIPNPETWTYERYARLPEDGRRHEIIGGEHHVTPAPRTRHQALVARLVIRLGVVVEDGDLGALFSAPCDVYFTEHDNVQPDLLFISKERESIITETRIEGAPDLVVEVISPSTRERDEVLKRDLYERFGVSEYWIVDSEAEAVTVLRSGGGGFGEPVVLSSEEDGVLESAWVPGFSLRLDGLF